MTSDRDLQESAAHSDALRSTGLARWLRRIAMGLSLVCIAAAPLAIGSVHRSVLVAHALVLGFALSLVAVAAQLRRRRICLMGLGRMLLVILALSGLQLLPLPAGLVAWLSPTTHVHVQSTWAALGAVAPDWMTLSLDPIATLFSALQTATLLLAAMILASTLTTARRIRIVLATLLATAAAVVLVGLVHAVGGAEQLYGFYQPERPLHNLPLPTCFVNSNHFAGLMVLLGPLALATARQAVKSYARDLAWLVFAFCTAGVLGSLSRGGIAAYLVTVALYLFLAPGKHSEFENRPSARLRGMLTALASILLMGVVMVALDQFFLGFRLQHEIEGASLFGKFQPMRDGIALIADFPWTGVGAGALTDILSSYSQNVATRTTHIENLLLQTTAEYGMPMAIGLFGLAFFWLRPTWRSIMQSPRLLACIVGAFGLIIHNFVDFSLQTLGVCLPFVALVTVVEAANREGHADKSSRGLAPLGVLVSSVVFLVTVAMAAWRLLPGNELGRYGGRVALALPRTAALQMLIDSSSPISGPTAMNPALNATLQMVTRRQAAAGLIEYVRQDLQQHPADGYRASLLGLQSFALQQYQTALTWFDRASQLSAEVAPRLFVARTLLHLGRERDALRSYRQLHRTAPLQVERELAQYSKTERLLAIAGSEGQEMLLGICDEWLRLDQQQRARNLLEQTLRREGKKPALLQRLGQVGLQTHDFGLADEMSTHLLALYPDKPDGWLLQASVYEAQEQWPRAYHMLLEATKRTPMTSRLQLRLIDACLKTDRLPEVESRLDALVQATTNDTDLRVAYLVRRSQLAEARSDLALALRELEAGLTLQPHASKLRLQVAQLNFLMGNLLEAERQVRTTLSAGLDPKRIPANLRALIEQTEPFARPAYEHPR